MIVHCCGVPGSGKSEIIRKLAEAFPFTNGIKENTNFIKWHIQCKDSGHDLQQELKVLAEKLLKNSDKVNQDKYQKIVDNLNKHKAEELVNVLLEINVPILIVVEDPPAERKAKLLQSLCRNIIHHSNKKKHLKKVPYLYYFKTEKCHFR